MAIDNLSDQAIDLPILDVSDNSKANAERLVKAAVHYGFLYISPHGSPFTRSLIESQFAISKQFFSQTHDDKELYHIGTDNRGWIGMHNERLDPSKDTKEFKEAFNIGELDAQGRPQQRVPGFMSNESGLQQLRTFEDACFETCRLITDLLGLGLEVEDGSDWFSERHGKPGSCTMRLLHYPSLPDDVEVSVETDVRAGAHSDYGSLTLLFQRPGQPGLEIQPPNESRWAPVPVFPDGYNDEVPPILVNIGDLMTYWTEGLLRSTVHRVIFPKDTKGKSDRYSIAFFCHPLDDAELIPVPSRIVKEHREKKSKSDGQDEYGHGGGLGGGRAITAKEHLMKRLQATYTHRVERD